MDYRRQNLDEKKKERTHDKRSLLVSLALAAGVTASEKILAGGCIPGGLSWSCQAFQRCSSFGKSRGQYSRDFQRYEDKCWCGKATGMKAEVGCGCGEMRPILGAGA